MNRKLDYSVALLVLCCAVWLASCAPEHDHVYQIPAQTDDGWETASLEAVGMNTELLGELIERIDRKEYRNVHGVLIVKNGKLVFEEYSEGYAFAYSGPWNSLAGKLHEQYADIPESHGDGYGYLWWLKTYEVDGKPVGEDECAFHLALGGCYSGASGVTTTTSIPVLSTI